MQKHNNNLNYTKLALNHDLFLSSPSDSHNLEIAWKIQQNDPK